MHELGGKNFKQDEVCLVMTFKIVQNYPENWSLILFTFTT